jgi:hypothetical protein
MSAPRPNVLGALHVASWREWLHGGRLLLLMSAGAFVIALLTLTIPSTPSYDPWAWLVWGKEIVHLDLHTPGGPSWKPLPMLFTTLFGPFGHFQPNMWLVVARAGAVMAVLMCFKLAWRLTRAIGPTLADRESASKAVRTLMHLAPMLAGVLAAGSLLNSPGFLSDNMLGYSEGLTVGLMLVAVDRFLDGARKQALVVGFFVALDRPETWPFLAALGAYVYWKDPDARRLVIGLVVLTLALWFLPSWWGSGDPLGGIKRAQNPRSNSAAFTSFPFWTVLHKEAWPTVLNRLKIPGIIAMLIAAVGLYRTRQAWWRKPLGTIEQPTIGKAFMLTIGLFGFLWWCLIGIETQAHFSGNARYLVLGIAPVGIACGVAWGWFAQTVAAQLHRFSGRRRALRPFASPRAALPTGGVVAIGLFLAVPPWISHNLIDLGRTHRALVYQASLREDLNRIVHQYGGAKKLLACGSVMVEGFQVPMVAWTLGVRTADIQAQPATYDKAGDALKQYAPNVILQNRANGSTHTALLPLPKTILHWEAVGVPYKLVAHIGTFRLFTACHK